MYRNLEAEIARAGLTRTALAKEMGLSKTTLGLKLNGKARLTLGEAVKLKKLVNVDLPIEELFSE